MLIFQKNTEEKSPVGPALMALFLFVVCGSGKSTIILNVTLRYIYVTAH